MKIAELRKTIGSHKKDELEFLVAELYKLIPKAKKEESLVDDLIKKPRKTKSRKAKVQKQKVRSIEDIASEVEFFTFNAKEFNYNQPNTTISKKERPKWRFVVKRLYKEILAAENEGDSKKRCAGEMKKLYETLTLACRYTMFNAYDVFDSVGITQVDFFEQVIRLYRDAVDVKDFVVLGIKLIIDNDLNRYTLKKYLMDVFLKYSQTPAMKELIVKEATKYYQEVISSKDIEDDFFIGGGRQDGMSYRKKSMINEITELISITYLELAETEKAIEFHYKHTKQSSDEVALYIIVRILFKYGLKNEIVREIEKNMKMKPRERLIELMNYIKKNDKLPEYM